LWAVASVALVRAAPTRTITVGHDIDAYPLRTDVTACAKPLEPRPGVAAFRTLVLSRVGGGDDGSAVCKKIANDSGEYSDHADGRAWDWHLMANRASDRAMADRVLDWLLRTDERGHRNAMARRIGITYVIWDHRYYRVGADDAHWVPYTSTGDPHDTHVHFSFSVAGALRQTSWWHERGPLAWLLAGSDMPLRFGQGPARPLAGDWDGDGRDSAGVYDPVASTFALRNAVTAGPADVTTAPVGPFGAIPLAGDWDGDGVDEVGVYDPPTHRFLLYPGMTGGAEPALVLGAAGDLPLVGDWNGDGFDDVGTYTPATQTFSLRLPDGSVRAEVFGGAGDTPLVGDWDGDGFDDIGAFRSSNHTFLRAVLRTGHGSRTLRPIRYGTGRHLPVIGDWDGDGVDEEGIVTPSSLPVPGGG
jgi:hypothetical protein